MCRPESVWKKEAKTGIRSVQKSGKTFCDLEYGRDHVHGKIRRLYDNQPGRKKVARIECQGQAEAQKMQHRNVCVPKTHHGACDLYQRSPSLHFRPKSRCLKIDNPLSYQNRR